ncbi:MAG: hypothetical protein WD877_01045 [Candidatus Saccharimonadales bacterium]
MKRKDIFSLVVTAVVTGLISLFITNALFKTPQSRAGQVPQAPVITTIFPDVKNDPAYKAFLNEQALDPTQPIQIGNTNNTSPFLNR